MKEKRPNLDGIKRHEGEIDLLVAAYSKMFLTDLNRHLEAYLAHADKVKKASWSEKDLV